MRCIRHPLHWNGRDCTSAADACAAYTKGKQLHWVSINRCSVPQSLASSSFILVAQQLPSISTSYTRCTCNSCVADCAHIYAGARGCGGGTAKRQQHQPLKLQQQLMALTHECKLPKWFRSAVRTIILGARWTLDGCSACASHA